MESPDVTYTYDQGVNGRGRLTKTSNSAVTTEVLQYDALGRQREIGKTIHGHSGMLTTAFDYDQAGRLTGMTYPDGYRVAYTYYYKTSLLHEVLGDNRTLVSYSRIQPNGATGLVDYGNNVADVYTFDQASGRLLGFFTESAGGVSGGNLQKLLYDYSKAGDVKTITDRVRGESNTFAYDDLHRLTGELASGFYTTGDRNVQLAYYGEAELPAVGRTAHTPKSATLLGQTYTYVYDANGNMRLGFDFSDPRSVATRDITFDANNMPVQIQHLRNGTTGTTDIIYDGDGKRAVKVAPSGITYYYGSHFIVDKGVNVVDKGVNVRYILAGSSRVIMQRQNAPGSPSYTTSYIHKDHLGSTSLITNDTDGGWEEKSTYQAYGLDRTRERQLTAPDNDYRYTGQEQDPEAGLYNYNARLYDPAAGVFISADSIVPNYADPQSLNRYAYARGNPLVYTDPSGHHFLGDFGEFFDDSWEAIKDDPVKAVITIAAAVTTTAIVAPFAMEAIAYWGVAGGVGPPTAAMVTAGNIGGAVIGGAAGGATAAAISGNNVGQGALYGGVSGGMFWGMDVMAAQWNTVGQIIGHGITGGVAAEIQGGRFLDGVLSASFSKVTSLAYDSMVGSHADPLPGENWVGQTTYSFDKNGRQLSDSWKMNVVGDNNLTSLCRQGSSCSMLLNLVPGINATARLHDYWFNIPSAPQQTPLMNWGTMLPAAAITYTALLNGPLSVDLAVSFRQ